MIDKNYTAPRIGTGTQEDPYRSKVDNYLALANGGAWCCPNGMVSGNNLTRVMAIQSEHDLVLADSQITEG